MFGVVRSLVNIVFGVIEFLLTLRFVFKFFDANPGTPFVAWLYGATASLINPFAKIFPNFSLGGFIIDSTTLAALVVFALIGYLLMELFSYVGPRYYSN